MVYFQIANQAIEHKIFIKHYASLTTVLNRSIMHLSKYFVAAKVITTEEEEEIHTARDKGKTFLWKMESHTKTGFMDGLNIMLDVMTKYGNVTDSTLAEQIRKEILDEAENGMPCVL